MKSMDTATLIISILSLCAAGIAAIYAIITYHLSRKTFKFSLFDKRYALYKEFMSLVSSLQEELLYEKMDLTGERDFERSGAGEYFFTSFYTLGQEAFYLFDGRVAHFIIEGATYFEPPPTFIPTYFSIKLDFKHDKDLESYIKKVNNAGLIKSLFDPYLLDKEFKKPEPYSYDDAINKFFGC